MTTPSFHDHPAHPCVHKISDITQTCIICGLTAEYIEDSTTGPTSRWIAEGDKERHFAGLLACLRRYRDGWEEEPQSHYWVKHSRNASGARLVQREYAEEAERAALDWLREITP